MERNWIANSDRAAYKCRPLRTANQLGWQILTPCDVELVWDGGAGVDAVTVACSDAAFEPCVVSHFRHGLVSFVVNAIFRTSPGCHTFLTGPINSLKIGAGPLSALMETDWLPFHFAMTWQLCDPQRRVRFRAGEPFAQFFEVDGKVQNGEELRHNSVFDDPVLLQQYTDYLAARRIDAADYATQNEARRPLGFYERGEYADGTPAVERTCPRHRSAEAPGEESGMLDGDL